MKPPVRIAVPAAESTIGRPIEGERIDSKRWYNPPATSSCSRAIIARAPCARGSAAAGRQQTGNTGESSGLPDHSKNRPWGYAAIAVLFLTIVLVGTIRLRLLDLPLERDEGEYAYAGQLILDGIAPYVGMYNMKLPGIYASYAAILALFGESTRAIRLGLLLVNAITIIFLFNVARAFLNRGGALVAAIVYALFSLSPAVQGLFANAEHFLLLFALPGIVLLFHSIKNRQPATLLAAGLFLGGAFIVKQHAVAYAAFALAALIVDTVTRRRQGDPIALTQNVGRFFYLAAGAILVYIATCIIFLAAGAFDNFWHWTVEYAGAYLSQVPLARAPAAFFGAMSGITASMPPLWALTGAGLLLLVLGKWPGQKRLLLFLFTLFSLAAVSPGFYFRPHYFILLLPAAAILAGGTVQGVHLLLSSRLPGGGAKAIAIVLSATCCFISIGVQRDFFFKLTPDQVCRRIFGLNPFVESPEIARFLRSRTTDRETIAVIGSEPQIYFYSSRRAATGYIYTYALMEKQPFALAMQQEMIREIEEAKPAFLIYVRNPHSWGYRTDSHTELLDWFGRYRDAHYHLAGLVNQYPTHSDYHWEGEIPWPPRSENWIAVLERNSRRQVP